MRKHAVFLLLLCASCWSSCQEPPPEWPAAAWAILPSAELLQASVVNKYYFHYLSADKYDKSTDIRYHAYELLEGGQLRLTVYDPGLDKISEMDFIIDEQGMHVQRAQQYWRGEQQDTEVEKRGWLNWQGDSTHFAAVTHFGGGASEYLQLRQQGPCIDTTVLERPAKRVAYLRQRDYTYTEGEERHYETSYTDYYAAGLGLVERRYVFDNATARLELIGQMSAADFAALHASVPKRVAYIDPDETLDRYGYFQPCNNDPNKIIDYYNGEVDAGFKTGKRGLEKALRAKVDKRLLTGESGYLTFRFVINCEGGTGWFITEEADLDFQPRAFSPATVQHVYDILKGLRNWQPGILRGEVVDTYAYVTLKISNGEIVEVLP